MSKAAHTIETVHGSEVRIGWIHVNIKLFLERPQFFSSSVFTFYFYPNAVANYSFPTG